MILEGESLVNDALPRLTGLQAVTGTAFVVRLSHILLANWRGCMAGAVAGRHRLHIVVCGRTGIIRPHLLAPL